MFVIRNKKIFLGLSAFFVIASIVVMSVWGLKVGIDFTGGTIVEVNYPAGRPDVTEIATQLELLDLGEYSLRGTGDDGYILRSRVVEGNERVELMSALSFNGSKEIRQERFNTIGPVIGKELRNKAFVAIIIVILAIVLFIAFAFRKVSEPVSSWKYGIIAIIALIHDVMIPAGVFAVLGKFTGAEVDILFIMALLAILGYSVNDTIVVFDRIRENLRRNIENRTREGFEETIGRSLAQTYTRSLNTSITTLIVLTSLFFIGGPTIHSFVLTLIVGVLAGTYSSIFLASPLLTIFEKNE